MTKEKTEDKERKGIKIFSGYVPIPIFIGACTLFICLLGFTFEHFYDRYAIAESDIKNLRNQMVTQGEFDRHDNNQIARTQEIIDRIDYIHKELMGERKTSH
jgi:hypothetical protein